MRFLQKKIILYINKSIKSKKLRNYQSVLKNKFGFTTPQSYAYDTRYPELVNYINKLSTKVIINNEI